MDASPDNVDMERLRKDIPKFLNYSRVISSTAKAWWEDFFSRASTIYSSNKEKLKSWLLDELKLVKFGNSTSSVKHATTISAVLSELSNAAPTNASVEISEMVAAQMDAIPEVRVLFHEFTDFSFLFTFSALKFKNTQFHRTLSTIIRLQA